MDDDKENLTMSRESELVDESDSDDEKPLQEILPRAVLEEKVAKKNQKTKRSSDDHFDLNANSFDLNANSLDCNCPVCYKTIPVGDSLAEHFKLHVNEEVCTYISFPAFSENTVILF